SAMRAPPSGCRTIHPPAGRASEHRSARVSPLTRERMGRAPAPGRRAQGPNDLPVEKGTGNTDFLAGDGREGRRREGPRRRGWARAGACDEAGGRPTPEGPPPPP